MMGEATDDSWQAENNRKATNLLGWSIAWVGVTALLAFGPKYVWDYSTLPTLGAVLLNLVVGFTMVMALVRHISGLDELERKIFLDAAGLTLGVTLVWRFLLRIVGRCKADSLPARNFSPVLSHDPLFRSLYHGW